LLAAASVQEVDPRDALELEKAKQRTFELQIELARLAASAPSK